jgi:tetratricopeptide (TPR) repeat protein
MNRRPRRPTPIRIPPPPTASVAEFVATFAAILGAIVVLLLVDSALARVDITGRRAYAVREFTTGEQLLAKGQTKEGIEHLRTAASLDAGNANYGTALAEATLAAGRAREAEQMLVPILELNATHGAANLAMARALAKEDRPEEAKSYYHRAIYGVWPPGSDRMRTTARFELIDFLARTNAKQELLAELLPIQDDSSNDVNARKQIAERFIAAGSPDRAVTIFRNILQKNSRDASAYVGLADAAQALGNFTSARTNLLAAQRLDSTDAVIGARVKQIDSVITLDPTQRGLSLGEQYRRSRNLIEMTLTSVRKCLGNESPQVAAALDSSAQSLIARPQTDGQGQSIEQTLALAQQLWGLRRTRCAPEAVPSPLSLVQDKIAQ